MGRFLVGAVLREVKNGRLNCNNPKNEEFKQGNDNATYVKKIRRGRETFPYASGQWQKKNIKGFAGTQENILSTVIATDSKSATSEGNPFKNYDEDVMGFMIAKNIELTEEEYENLSKEEQEGFKKDKGIYKKNVTKKRRSNLMLSPLQSIGPVKITEEFSTRETDNTPLLYLKEVYSADMASGFILDIDRVGVFQASINEAGFRDYHTSEVEKMDVQVDEDGMFSLEREDKIKRIYDTIDGLHFMNTRITMSNNLEDLSAKFIILADYSIGSAIFNNIFGEGKFKVEYLKEEIDKVEKYRLSKIYIGCNEEYFKQEDRYLKDILKYHFEKNDIEKDGRIVLGSVASTINGYKEYLKTTL